MTTAELKKATIEVIETVPEAYMEKFFEETKNLAAKFNAEEKKKLEIFARLDELFEKEKAKPVTEEARKRAHQRAEIFRKSVEAIDKIIGDDRPWANDEEVMEEIYRERQKIRQRKREEIKERVAV